MSTPKHAPLCNPPNARLRRLIHLERHPVGSAVAEALSPSDLSAISAERGPVHMHVGGVCVFDGHDRARDGGRAPARAHPPDPALHDAARGHAARAGQPGVGGRRVVRRRPPRAPRGAAGARAATASCASWSGQVLSEPLDRSRPLWQLTVVEGLPRRRTAIVAKMHHALVDGLAAVDVSTVILDPTRGGPRHPAARADARPRSAGASRGSTSSRGSPRRRSSCRASSRARRSRARSTRAPTRARCATPPEWSASWRACARRRRTRG